MKRLLRFSILSTLAACGSNNSGQPIDAAMKDAPKPIDAAPDAAVDARPADAEPATGTPHHFVVSKEHIPTNSTEANTFGLDLNGDTTIDNQLGMVLASFATQGFNSQTAADTAVDHGTILMLGDFLTTDFTTATDAGFTIYAGANPVPTPCNGANDTVCRHHLTGTGTFDISATSAHDAPLVGNVVAGSFTGSPGTLTIQLPILSASAQVSLIGARVKIVGATATGFTNAIVGGGVTQEQVSTNIYPAVVIAVNARIATDCTALANPPTCGCASGSAGPEMVGLLDTNHDCSVSLAEVSGNSVIQNLFTPDLTIDGQMAISVGIGIEAVAGTFTEP